MFGARVRQTFLLPSEGSFARFICHFLRAEELHRAGRGIREFLVASPPPSLPSSPGSRFEDRKNEKKKGGWGAEGDRSVRQKRNIVLICVIDARGRIRFKAKVIERGEQGKKVGGRGGGQEGKHG